MCSRSFTPAKDIPSLEGKVILVTGGNTGIGKQAILEYAHHNPAEIWMAARDLTKAQQAVDDIHSQLHLSPPPTIKLLQLDLTSLASVQQAARTFVAASPRLDILMLNAGIMSSPPGLTKDGYEVQLGTNHLGHALLAKLLLPTLEHTASQHHSDVRVVVVSSAAHAMAPRAGILFETLKTPAENLSGFERYGQSKTASILWTRRMARAHPTITWASLHPGVVQTGLQAGATGASLPMRAMLKVGRAFMVGVEKGVLNQLWASVSKDVVSGEYYEPVGVSGKGSKAAEDDVLGQRVLEWTDKELEGWSI